MRTGRVLAVAIGLVVVFGVVSALALGGVSSGKAIEVPGAAAIYSGDGRVISVSCASAGNCAAVGNYESGAPVAFLVDEKKGVWGNAIAVPGVVAQIANASVVMTSISCGSAGNCAATGSYPAGFANNHELDQVFVVEEKNGVWGNAMDMPGVPAFASSGSIPWYVSCASAGNCAAGGYYEPVDGKGGPYVVDEKNGVWGTAQEVPGLAAFPSLSGSGAVTSISCATAGNCTAGARPAFVTEEKNGVWKDASQYKGNDESEVTSVSCSSAGNCTAGGHGGSAGYYKPFVMDEKNGVWRPRIQVPGIKALNTNNASINASITTVSCRSAGSCTIVGNATTSKFGRLTPFIAEKKNGVWRTAHVVPGLATLARSAYVTSVSCASPGNCAAGGSYADRAGHSQAFLVNEKNGVWGNAYKVPGTAPLNTDGHAGVTSVSCAGTGRCAAGGYYLPVYGYYDTGQGTRAFVTTP